ncbi:hypothetical protein [Microbacterium phyllosphaerae]|uniref:hypothetical protein n=1 Tax=Microbacterium phyllosphaerae TaxID=124798 RepID=UPI001AE6BCAB|nr:hypothetical protein [Microbacterium phyllosphaerae]
MRIPRPPDASTPDPYKAKTVFACGDWSVVASDDGWFGWTPNSEEERNAAAAE